MMAGNIKDHILTIRRKAVECSCGLMADNMMECGKMASRKVQESTATLKEKYVMVSGLMEREASGLQRKSTINLQENKLQP